MWNVTQEPDAAVMKGLSSNDFRSAVQTAWCARRRYSLRRLPSFSAASSGGSGVWYSSRRALSSSMAM